MQKIKCMFLTIITNEERGQLLVSDFVSNKIKSIVYKNKLEPYK